MAIKYQDIIGEIPIFIGIEDDNDQVIT